MPILVHFQLLHRRDIDFQPVGVRIGAISSRIAIWLKSIKYFFTFEPNSPIVGVDGRFAGRNGAGVSHLKTSSASMPTSALSPYQRLGHSNRLRRSVATRASVAHRRLRDDSETSVSRRRVLNAMLSLIRDVHLFVRQFTTSASDRAALFSVPSTRSSGVSSMKWWCGLFPSWWCRGAPRGRWIADFFFAVANKITI